jgi:hypothetical protein
MSSDHDEFPAGSQAREFAAQAEQQGPGLLAELLAFLGDNKKWWLLPILVALLVVGALIVLASTAAAPLIYPLF